MAGTFNQSLQCTQDVFVGFQAPSPPVSEKATGGWARSEFEDLFKTYPRIEDAYWETIVKLWQLSRLEDDADTEIWQDHFLAWLVSSLSVFELMVTDFRFG